MNFAHISNLVFERDDGESVPDFRARVRSLVAELGGGVLAWGAPEVIDIEGGLKDDATGDFATVGDVLVEREDGELIEALRARARARAFGLGSSHVVFGGLTPVKYEDEPT